MATTPNFSLRYPVGSDFVDLADHFLKLATDVDTAIAGNLPLAGGTVTGNLTVNGGIRTNGFTKALVTKTSAYTLTSADHVVVATSGTWNATLPTAASVAGKEFVVKNSGSGTVTVTTTASQTIDGQPTFPLLQYESLTVISNGSNWVVI